LKSKYANVLTLAVAAIAFVPMLAVDYLLDGYVRTEVRASLQHSADAVATRIHERVSGATAVLDTVVASSPSLCTPTFIANVHRAMAASLNVKQVLVENTDRVQYCDALGRDVVYSPVSEELTIPGDSETLQVVTYADMTMPALKVNHRFGDSRTVAAFVPLLGERGQSLLDAHRASLVRVSLTNGTPVLTTGNAQDFDARTSSFDFVSAQSVAEQLPLRVEVAVPFELARARYGDLDVAFTLTAGLMSALFLLMALQYTRSSKIPSFDLERAISRNEIKPFYQPVINLRTGALEGCEVLCRWEKPNGKIVGPNAFIEYAELTGLALPMTLSLMEQVKHDLGSLAAEMPDIKISINLFDGHFQDGAIVEDVQAIFGGSQIGYHQLVFEITERRPLGDSPQTFAVISGLHALGAKLALDDTGTGHSNLAYLATLGVDVIKIDRIFVDMIKPGVTQVPVLDGLIAMAKDLDTEIVAEGVETEEQAIYLRARGVYQAQGFLFAPALRPAAFRELAHALNSVSRQRDEADVADAA
jgi:sensor c-di-GMP phosphodiesterase-like protein